MKYRWVIDEAIEQEADDRLQQELGVHPLVTRLLVRRGITTFSDAKAFFRPDLTMLHDPFLMKGMDAAVKRLQNAIQKGEKILIYGDYDVDGTTATAMMVHHLGSIGADVCHHIPHRFKEGYGIRSEGIQAARDAGAGLIISVDCGITAIQESLELSRYGIDLIVCDHHTVGDELPVAIAVLDPKRPDCPYPFKELTGAGVAFKLLQAHAQQVGLEPPKQLLDLVAISTASDIVPILGENRVLMREGLRILNEAPRPGLLAMIRRAKMAPGTLNSTSIVFSIAPRINAAGRMGDASAALRLLLTESEQEARAIAQELDAINTQRRELDARIFDEAVAMVEREDSLTTAPLLVLHRPDWHLGVMGIAAARIVEKYNKPAVLLTSTPEGIKGSARSVKGFNIYEAIRSCQDLLTQFGGHAFAAGLTFAEDHLSEFRGRLVEVATREMADVQTLPELEIDAEIDLRQLDRPLWKILSQFEPYGPENQNPVFISKRVRICGEPTVVANAHLKFRLQQKGSEIFEAIGFNMLHRLPALTANSSGEVDVAYLLEENHFAGRRRLQMTLKDMVIPS